MDESLLKWAQTNAHARTIRDYRADILAHCLRTSGPAAEGANGASGASNGPCGAYGPGAPAAPALQQEISLLRSSVLNSLMDVTLRLSWSPSTFALSVHLFDHYTAHNKIDLSKCVLLGFCALWITFKYNENKPKAKLLGALLKRAGYPPQAKSDFVQLEFSILECVNWDLSYVSPDALVDLLLDPSDPNYAEKRLGAIFLCEISLFTSDIVGNYSTAEIANSAIALTNVAWKNLRHKHIKNHKYYELDRLVLTAILNLEPAIKFKYLNPNYAQGSIVSNLINLAVQFLREGQFNGGKTASHWVLADCDSATPGQAYLVSPTASPVTPSMRTTSHAPSNPHTPQYLLPTPGTTPTSASYSVTSNTRATSLYQTPAQRQPALVRSASLHSSHGSLGSLADLYSPIVGVPQEPGHHRHIPILTRSRARTYMQTKGYLNDIPTVLLSQQLDQSAFKRRRL